MKITKHFKPVEYLVVEDVYTDDELRLINKEIDFLLPKLKPPEETLSAIDNNQILKQNKSLFLDSVYIDRNVSDILTLNRRTFCHEIIGAMKSLHPAFYAVENCNGDTTLLNYYGETDCYRPHRDVAPFTFLTFFIPEDKQYSGGDLVVEDVTIEQKNNMLIGFAGSYKHHVTPIKLTNPDAIGRISMSQFLFIQHQ